MAAVPPPRRFAPTRTGVFWAVIALFAVALVGQGALSLRAVGLAAKPAETASSPIDLTRLPWVAQAGLVPPEAVLFDAPGTRQVAAFPISLNKLFAIPADGTTNEFTLATRFTLNADDPRDSVPLAFGLAEVGDNWAVFLNGRLLRNEIYREANGTMRISRSLTNVVIRIPPETLRHGENTLVVHLVGTAFASWLLSGWAPGFPLTTGYVIDSADSLLTARMHDLILPLITLGIGSFFALYHLLFYARRRADYSNLLFAFYLLNRTLNIGARTFRTLDLYPDTGLLYRLAYANTTLLLPIFLLFLWVFFFADRRMPRWLQGITGVGLALGLVTLFAPLPWIEPPLRFTTLLTPIFLVAVFSILVKALRERRPDAVKLLIVIVITVGFSGWDVLDVMIFHTGGLVGAQGGPLFMSLGLILVLANHFWRVSADAERLNLALAERNRDLAQSRDQLEDLVSERTSALQRANTQLALAVVQAQAASRAKSAFLANMSHEIRTPLHVMLGFAQVLTRDVATSTHQREHLSTIQQSGTHLLQMINDVLDLSKIEAGRLTLTPAATNLAQLLAEVQQLFAKRAAEHRLALRLEAAADLPRTVSVDGGKLRQVLINLLDNAVKFTERGEIVITVRCIPAAALDATTVAVEFAVRDTGAGIAPDELDALFVTFQQTASGRQTHQGTGLGLALSRQIIRQMGGDIVCESTSGHGSRFWFTLPLLVTQDVAPLQQVVGLLPDQRQQRVLIADDNAGSRRATSELLRLLGTEAFAICEAEDGLAALAQWAQWRPDVILMDVRMPNMDGLEATRQIRAQAAPDAPPIILAVTASLSLDGQALNELDLFDAVLSKPLHADVLYQALAQQLGLRFIYANESRAVEEPLDEAALVARMRQHPTAWLAQFSAAARIGEIAHITALLAQVRATDPQLAAGLDLLADRFDMLALLHLSEAATTGLI